MLLLLLMLLFIITIKVLVIHYMFQNSFIYAANSKFAARDEIWRILKIVLKEFSFQWLATLEPMGAMCAHFIVWRWNSSHRSTTIIYLCLESRRTHIGVPPKMLHLNRPPPTKKNIPLFAAICLRTRLVWTVTHLIPLPHLLSIFRFEMVMLHFFLDRFMFEQAIDNHNLIYSQQLRDQISGRQIVFCLYDSLYYYYY